MTTATKVNTGGAMNVDSRVGALRSGHRHTVGVIFHDAK